MMPIEPPETIVTYLIFVDQFDRLIEKIPVAPTRRHHLMHSHMTPVNAVACRYYDVRMTLDPFSTRKATHTTTCNYSDWIPLQQFAVAN